MINCKNIKTVFFDLDGTLTSYQESVRNALDYIFQSIGHEIATIEHDTFCETYWKIFDRLEQQQQTEGKKLEAIADRVKRFTMVLAELGQKSRDDIAERMALLYSEGRVRGVYVFKDAHEVIALLQQQYSLGIITEGSSKYQRELLHNAGLNNFFDHIIISEEVGYHKPDPRLFQTACERATCNPNQSAMIGDRIDWDMIPSKITGMQTILFTQDSRYFEHQKIDPGYIDAIAPNYRTISTLLLHGV